jgi:hypothetical protein
MAKRSLAFLIGQNVVAKFVRPVSRPLPKNPPLALKIEHQKPNPSSVVPLNDNRHHPWVTSRLYRMARHHPSNPFLTDNRVHINDQSISICFESEVVL